MSKAAVVKKALEWGINLTFPRLCEATGEPLSGLAGDNRWEYLSAQAASGLYFLDNAHACGSCGVPLYGLVEGERLCAGCKAKPPLWGRFGGLLRYYGPAREWVRHYKYRNAAHLEREFAKLIAANADFVANYLAGALVVPVPLHPLKEFTRGFNQSAHIAQMLIKHSAAPAELFAKLLVRTRYTRPQASLRRKDRAANVKNAFDINGKIDLNKWQSRRVVVVDDLLTSGSTLSACVKALKDAGFDAVDVFCLART